MRYTVEGRCHPSMERVPIPWILTEAQQVYVCCSALRKLSPAVDNTTHTKSFASRRDDFLFALYHPSYRELREHGHNVPYDKRKKLEARAALKRMLNSRVQ